MRSTRGHDAEAIVERLRHSHVLPLVRLIDDADLDRPAEVDPTLPSSTDP